MEIKDRVIRIGKLNDSTTYIDCILIDEIGIKDGDVFQRNIIINENFYTEFEKNPDQELNLDTFLEQHNINSEWIGYANKVLRQNDLESKKESPSILHDDVDIETVIGVNKNEIYKNMYDDLSKRESLIENPLIIDVFNEAIRDDSELSNWESVYPFFR